jgi:predicted MFS family arabinose efflux permease
VRFRFSGLWQHRDFTRLWAGQTTSSLGSQITFLALPLTAILVLKATPAQMGVLTALGAVPSLFLGVAIGVWMDRRRRRPILVASDLARAALLLVVPISVGLHVLHIEVLYILALGIGTLNLLFAVGHMSLLPWLVGRNDLVEANAKLALSSSASEVVGPGVAGALIGFLTAPVALIVDAVTFVVSALAIQSIRADEPAPIPSNDTKQVRRFWRDAREGITLVARNRVLATLLGLMATLSLFNAVLEAVWILYVTQKLGLSAHILGIAFAAGGLGFMLGASVAQPALHRLGVGRAIILGALLTATSDLMIPLAGGPMPVVIGLLITGQFFFGVGSTVLSVGFVSLRQAATPTPMLGRMNSVMLTILGGVVPVGALAGGLLGQTLGLRPTLFIAIAGELLATLWVIFSPVRTMQELPGGVE